jgi:hypothetical protein
VLLWLLLPCFVSPFLYGLQLACLLRLPCSCASLSAVLALPLSACLSLPCTLFHCAGIVFLCLPFPVLACFPCVLALLLCLSVSCCVPCSCLLACLLCILPVSWAGLSLVFELAWVCSPVSCASLAPVLVCLLLLALLVSCILWLCLAVLGCAWLRSYTVTFASVPLYAPLLLRLELPLFTWFRFHQHSRLLLLYPIA